MTTTNEYIIAGGTDGKSRLNVLSDVLSSSTKSLLEQNGLTAGASLLDAGCGGGNVAVMAAHMVGESGKITAVDFDAEIIALARQDAATQHISNISFRTLSAYDLDYTAEFDLVYARFLLSHMQHPQDVIGKMLQSLKPGGRVVVEDVQFSGHYCYPACNAFSKYLKYYSTLAAQNNQNAEIGPSLPGLFHKAGLQQVGFDTIQPSFSSGPGKWMAWLTLDRIKHALTAHSIASMDEINSMLKELEDFTNDEQTIISLPRIFRVWGHKNPA